MAVRLCGTVALAGGGWSGCRNSARAVLRGETQAPSPPRTLPLGCLLDATTADCQWRLERSGDATSASRSFPVGERGHAWPRGRGLPLGFRHLGPAYECGLRIHLEHDVPLCEGGFPGNRSEEHTS